MKIKENINLLKIFVSLYYRYDQQIILTGSLALILSKKLEERQCDDIDIVIPHFIDFSDVATVMRINNPYTNPAFELRLKDTGTIIHVVIDNECFYTRLKLEELNSTIKVSNHEDILIEKFKSFLFFGTEKNKNDIQNFFKIIDESKTIKSEELPI